MGFKSDLAGTSFNLRVVSAPSIEQDLHAKSQPFAPADDPAFICPLIVTIWLGETRCHWLPYFPGKITIARTRDAPVLTGKMSGCPLAVFHAGGVPHLAHIGTIDTDRPNADAVNAAVKSAWNRAVARGRMRPVKAWNPLRDITSNPASISTDIFAAVSTTGKTYSIGCKANPVTGLYEIKESMTSLGVAGVNCVRSLLNAPADG